MRKAVIGLLFALGVTGCSSWLPTAHRVPLQQGNALTTADIHKLKPGLTRDRVRELLGSPIQQTPFHDNRWDYVYYAGAAGQPVGKPQRLTLYFDGKTLARIVDHYQPPSHPAAATRLGPRPTKSGPEANTGQGTSVPAPGPTPGRAPGPAPGPGAP